MKSCMPRMPKMSQNSKDTKKTFPGPVKSGRGVDHDLELGHPGDDAQRPEHPHRAQRPDPFQTTTREEPWQ